MSEKVLMNGNEALAEAAILAGCRHYFGYPITPQTEVAADASCKQKAKSPLLTWLSALPLPASAL